MPTISKIRLTNVVYEHGQKRYHDELFLFDGINGAVVLENGGGKTVFIQTVLQAVIPHTQIGDRTVGNTLYLDEGPAHIAIEWILNDSPRRYVLTAVTLFKKDNQVKSLRYVYEYGENDVHSIENIPFVQKESEGIRPSGRGEMSDYYSYMTNNFALKAKTFPKSIISFQEYIEEQYNIVHNEWESIVRINGSEGDVEKFFENCKKTNELVDRLLIPSIEQGLAGFKLFEFAEMFENHRDQFKQYKELKEKIAECYLLQTELSVYVETFRGVHEEEQKYLRVRQLAKGYKDILADEIQQLEISLLTVQTDFKQHEAIVKVLEQKRKSMRIYEEEQKLEKLVQEEEKTQTELAETEKEINDILHKHYSLRFAKHREEVNSEQESLHVYERELQKLDEDEEVSLLHSQLKQLQGKLHYVFTQLKEQITQAITATTEQQIKLNGQKEIAEQTKKEHQTHATKLQTEMGKYQSTLQHTEEEMRKIKSKLVAHDDEIIDELLASWIERANHLETDEIALTKRVKDIMFLLADGRQVQKQANVKKLELEKNIATKKVTKEQFNKAEQQLIEQLGLMLPQWSFTQSIYNRSTSIVSQISERIEKEKRNKEDSLLKERLARRFVDDYHDQDVFFADPYVAKNMEKWNQFSYLKAGIEFIQTQGTDVEQSDYQFWALTLVTAAAEKESLIEKLKSLQHYLLYPIFVLTLDEATETLKGYEITEKVVEPSNWQEHRNPKSFSKWKEENSRQADVRQQERIEIEGKLKRWEQLKVAFERFLRDYPYEQYKSITDELRSFEYECELINDKLLKLDEEMTNLEQEKEAKQTLLEDSKRELQNLYDVKIPQANDYIRFSKLLPLTQKEITSCHMKMEQAEKAEVELQHHIDQLQLSLIEGNKRISDLNAQMKYEVENHDIYFQVKTQPIIETSEHMQALLNQHEAVTAKLNQMQKSRGEWIAKQDNTLKRIRELKGMMDGLQQEFEQIDEQMHYPVDGEEQIKQSFDKRKITEMMLNKVQSYLASAKVDRKVQEKEVHTQREDYFKQFGNVDVVKFYEDLKLVAKQLAEESEDLQKREAYLAQQQKHFLRENEICTKANLLFERHEFQFSLDNPKLEARTLSQEEITEFMYNREKIVMNLIHELSEMNKDVAKYHELLAEAKNVFIKFSDVITEPKMRKNAVSGVVNKSTYEDILEHQYLLNNSIEQVVKISEAAIQDYDKEQEQFVTYVHTHLRKVREDLRDISKRTRVRVGTDWKTIFKIDVPDWDDDFGKERIREHIDWIITQIDTGKFAQDDGKEDSAQVRKFLESSLHTVPILRIVLGNQIIKVRCCKVESADLISSTYYSWEESNRWSGGEKWSKNMALFLGLLNFIAEKSQRIESNTKRNRVVILDNPFGKASSDHVLNPIFFIGEQLGFQIITLTAHAEGKFLSDYFPVVYSCRLRQLEGQSKQVLTKDKYLQKAYLRDNAPESLARLGEKQQLTLF